MENRSPSLFIESRDLFVFHRAIARPEVNRARGHLCDSAAAPNGLVVDLNIRMQIVVLIEPLGINWVRERGACAVQLCLRH